VFEKVERTARLIAEAGGATVAVRIDSGYPVTHNNESLTERMLPSMQRAAGNDRVSVGALVTGAEDFSYYQEKVPGMFVFLGVTPRDRDWRSAPSNHSPFFFADESALPVGVRTMASLAVDYLSGPVR
jgi:amidohydrolase